MSLNEGQTHGPLASLNSSADASGARRAKLSLLRLVRPASPSSLSRASTFSWSPTKYLHSSSGTSRLPSQSLATDLFPRTPSNIKLHPERTRQQHNKTKRRSASVPPHCDTLTSGNSKTSTFNNTLPFDPCPNTRKVSPSSIFSKQDDPFRYSPGLPAYKPFKAASREPAPPTDNSVTKNCEATQIDCKFKSKSSPDLFQDHAENVLPSVFGVENHVQVEASDDAGTLTECENRVAYGSQSLPTHFPFGAPSLEQLRTPTPPLGPQNSHDIDRSHLSPIDLFSDAPRSDAENTSFTTHQPYSKIRASLEPCDLGIPDSESSSHAAATVSESHSDVFLSSMAICDSGSKPHCGARLSHLRSSSTQHRTEQVYYDAAGRVALLIGLDDRELQDPELQITINCADTQEDANAVSDTLESLEHGDIQMSGLPSNTERDSQSVVRLHETIQMPSLHPGCSDAHDVLSGSGTPDVAPGSTTSLRSCTAENRTTERLSSSNLSPASPTRHRNRRRGLIFDNLPVPVPIETVLALGKELETNSQISTGVKSENVGDDSRIDEVGNIAHDAVGKDDYSPVSETLDSYFDAFDTSTGTIKPEIEFTSPCEQRPVSPTDQTDYSARPLSSLQDILVTPENGTLISSCSLDFSASSESTTSSCCKASRSTCLTHTSRSAPPPSATRPSSEIPALTALFSLSRSVSGSSRSPSRRVTPSRTPSPLRLEITSSPPPLARRGLQSGNNDAGSNSFVSIPAAARTAATHAATWAMQRSVRVKEMISSHRHEYQTGRNSYEENSNSPSLHHSRSRTGSFGGLRMFTHIMPIKLPARASSRGRRLSRNENPTVIAGPTATSPTKSAASAADTNAELVHSDSPQKHVRSGSPDGGAPFGSA